MHVIDMCAHEVGCFCTVSAVLYQQLLLVIHAIPAQHCSVGMCRSHSQYCTGVLATAPKIQEGNWALICAVPNYRRHMGKLQSGLVVRAGMHKTKPNLMPLCLSKVKVTHCVYLQ